MSVAFHGPRSATRRRRRARRRPSARTARRARTPRSARRAGRPARTSARAPVSSARSAAAAGHEHERGAPARRRRGERRAALVSPVWECPRSSGDGAPRRARSSTIPLAYGRDSRAPACSRTPPREGGRPARRSRAPRASRDSGRLRRSGGTDAPRPHRARLALAAALLGAALAAGASTAGSPVVTVSDRVGDGQGPPDVCEVTVMSDPWTVAFRITFADARRSSPANG